MVRRRDLGRSLFAVGFPEFLPAKDRAREGVAVKEEAQGVVRPAAEGEDTALRALTARHRGLRSREKAMDLGKTISGRRARECTENQRRAASAPACRRHA